MGLKFYPNIPDLKAFGRGVAALLAIAFALVLAAPSCEDSSINGNDPDSTAFHSYMFMERLNNGPFPYDCPPEKIDVIFCLPPAFDPKGHFSWVVFFHGPNAEVEEHAMSLGLPAQAIGSKQNLILVVPLFAFKPMEQSADKTVWPADFRSFMDEAANAVNQKLEDDWYDRLAEAPILLAAFGGGEGAAAHVLENTGVSGRIKGVFIWSPKTADDGVKEVGKDHPEIPVMIVGDESGSGHPGKNENQDESTPFLRFLEKTAQ